MTIEEAEKHYGNLARVCQALGIQPQNVTRWKRQGYLPWVHQFRLAKLTRSKLKADLIDPKVLKREGKL